MVVEIMQVQEHEVLCRTRYGEFSGHWVGEVPSLETKHHVELDVDGALTWGEEIKESDQTEHGIRSEAGQTVLVGALESYAEDGCAVIRIGMNLLFVETVGASVEVGRVVECRAGLLTLHPYEV